MAPELTADNGNEYISGTWTPSENMLTLTRPVTGYVQYYTYFLDGQPYSTYPQMHGVVRGTAPTVPAPRQMTLVQPAHRRAPGWTRTTAPGFVGRCSIH